MVSELEHEEATARGEEMLKTLPRATAVRFDAAMRQVIVELCLGYSLVFAPERAQELNGAKAEDLAEVEITHPGFGIYFPRLDADLWVPAMVQGRFGNDRWEEQWAAQRKSNAAA